MCINLPGRFLAAAFSILVCSGLQAADTFTVDANHSSLLFRASRFGVVNVYGRFNALSGTVVVDEDNPAGSSIQIEIKTESVDTANERRDNHLRSPDFFDATQFPVITFKSTQVRATGSDSMEVNGNLTLHGVTQPIVATVRKVGEAKHPRRGTAMIGFETELVIRRSEFGMKYMLEALSDEIRIVLALHATGE